MVFSVTQVQVVLVLSKNVTDALRMMELRLIVAAIYQADLAVTNLVLKLHRIFVDHHKSIVGSVGHNNQVMVQSGLLLDADDLAWVAQMLLTSGSLLTTFADGLVLTLCPNLICLFLFWLPPDCAVVIQPFVVKVVRY